MEIKLPSGRAIGDGHPVFIIAEVGSNWATLDDCLTSISQAKACGADAVKFQLYNCMSLYGFPRRHSMDYFGLEGSLPTEWLPKLKIKADAVGIEFMCSAFSPELIDAVDPFVSIHKVASAEMCHVRMLERLREIGKPVILSTGAQHFEDINRALRILGEHNTILLYCVAAYPANDMSLELIQEIPRQFGTIAGFSDHSTDIGTIPKEAASHGAQVIEKHVNFVGATGPDAPHSIDGEGFKWMCKRIRYEDDSEPYFGPTKAEQGMVTRHKRRLIATRDINAGDRFIEGENFGIYRSLKDDAKAMSPFMVDKVNGRTAIVDIRAGDGIAPDNVK